MLACCAVSGLRADAHLLLERAYFSEYGSPMPAPARTDGGKPYFPDRPGVFCSLSHTEGRVMAVVGGAPCGCDVERVRAVPPRLERRVCSAQELSEFDFFELWVLKESYIKLVGGLTADYRELCFSRRGGAISAPEPDVRCRLYSVPGFRAAVVCRGAEPPAELTYFSVSAPH